MTSLFLVTASTLLTSLAPCLWLSSQGTSHSCIQRKSIKRRKQLVKAQGLLGPVRTAASSSLQPQVSCGKFQGLRILTHRVATALCCFDHIITLDAEIKYIWRRRVSGASVLFILNRYSLLAASLASMVQFLPFQTVNHDAKLDAVSLNY